MAEEETLALRLLEGTLAWVLPVLGEHLFVGATEVNFNEVVFEVDFELVLLHLQVLLIVFLLERHLLLGLLDSLHGGDWHSNQWLGGVGDGVRPALVEPERLRGHLHPPGDVRRHIPSLVLEQLSLEQHLVVRVN